MMLRCGYSFTYIDVYACSGLTLLSKLGKGFPSAPHPFHSVGLWIVLNCAYSIYKYMFDLEEMDIFPFIALRKPPLPNSVIFTFKGQHLIEKTFRTIGYLFGQK